MDYEYYSVDPYYPLDPQRDIDTVREVLTLFDPEYQKAAAAIAKFFRPIMRVKCETTIFPLEAKPYRDTLLIHCETPADLEATLLRR